jgi:putative holliday junction resolvase
MNNDYYRILGIDYGSVRIGISISDPMRIIAQGLKTIVNDSKSIDEIVSIVSAQNVKKIIVGMPLNLKGEPGIKADEVAQFIASLKNKTAVEISTHDERFTSVMAQKAIITMGMTKKQRRNKSKIDEVASAIMLQSFLDSKSPKD